MKRYGPPKMFLIVWGDWQTVISAREYRDALLSQKPFDETDADYSEYRVPCDNTLALVNAYLEFGKRLKLHCAFAFSFDSADGMVKSEIVTGSGYGKDDPVCEVTVSVDKASIASKVKSAIDILEEAVG